MDLDFLDNQTSDEHLINDLVLDPQEEKFSVAKFSNPGDFLTDVFSHEQAPKKLEFIHGTTTLGFIFNEGIIVCVDSRSTQGPYIASQSVKKVIEINPFLLGTMAGGAADCAFWERELGRQCRLFELRNKKRISVAAASKILSNILYSYRGRGLSVGTMITGWDLTGNPALYYCDNDGTRLKGKMFAVGSGGTFAYGILDAHYRPDLSIQEAQELGKRAIYHATHRDAYSGGTVNLYHVTQGGWNKISSTDCFELHKQYQNEKNL